MSDMELERPSLYIVATPIGNLGDVTLRASKVLGSCDLIAAEDTRVTSKLLKLLELPHKKLISFYDQVEQSKASKLIQKIKEENLAVALVSDAGTPVISDPGYVLCKAAHEQGVKVIPIPGPSSLTALVCASGIASNRVLFLGFLPKKKSLIRTEMSKWPQHKSSLVFFESTKRIMSTLEILAELYPDSEVCIGRELTKLNETIKKLDCLSMLTWLREEAVLKGEMVVMVSLPDQKVAISSEELKEKIKKAMTENPNFRTKEIAQLFSSSGLATKDLYQLVLEVKNEEN